MPKIGHLHLNCSHVQLFAYYQSGIFAPKVVQIGFARG